MSYEINPKSVRLKLPNGETTVIESLTINESLAMAAKIETRILDVLQQGMPIIKASRASLIRGEMPTVEAASYDTWEATMYDPNRSKFYAQAGGAGFPGGHEPHVWFPTEDTSELTLDGRFTLEHLKRIVASWEAYIEATGKAQENVDNHPQYRNI